MSAWPPETGSLDFSTLRSLYGSGALKPGEVLRAVLARIARQGDDKVWISRPPDAEVLRRAGELEARLSQRGAQRALAELPLLGLPFAVKDNIDAAGLPTTAACPAYAYLPRRTATAVERLLAAGAVLVGKTNLDQFATGLVGVRSPYGTPRNPFDGRYIPGGSSSGSGVAVSAGLVSFALGTDTAGSGRVPAGFLNVVGLKPTRGLVSATGVVPACRSLDCVSVLALTVPDALGALRVMAGEDPEDPYSRPAPAGCFETAAPLRGLRVGVPRPDQRDFFGDREAGRLFASGVQRLAELGPRVTEVDFEPFRETAELLYGGPWVAERLAAIEAFLAKSPEALHPVTREIIEGGRRYSAADAFRAMYRLEALRRRTAPCWREMDALAVPTSGTIYTAAEVEADPIRTNTNLGRYTNFANLLDLSAIAVPNGMDGRGLPGGITFLAPAFREGLLCALGEAFQRAGGLPLGAGANPIPPA
ncbi:MAG: allophanate hydrolase [Nitrospinota bacterium]